VPNEAQHRRPSRAFLPCSKSADNWGESPPRWIRSARLAAIAGPGAWPAAPGLLFENVIGSPDACGVNLLGTVQRVVWSHGDWNTPSSSKTSASRLALLQQPRPPKGLKEAMRLRMGVLWDVVKARPDRDPDPPCPSRCFKGESGEPWTRSLLRPWPGRLPAGR